MDYHDIQALNASGINAFYRSPLHYWVQSPFNPARERSEPTPAMVMGSLAHCLVLQPEAFNEEYVILEKEKYPHVLDTVEDLKSFIKEAGGKPKGKKEELIAAAKQLDSNVLIWEEFKEKMGSKKRIISSQQYDDAVALREAMLANTAVKKLLGNGCSEMPVTWQREEGGIPCKAKLDYLRSGLLVDYKTTEDGSLKGFSRSLANYGYYRQMAWYMEAAEVAYGERPRGAVLIVQEKSLPEAIGIYSLDAESLELGAQECDFAYRAITERLQSGKWEAYPERIQEIKLPFWFMKERFEHIEERSYV